MERIGDDRDLGHGTSVELVGIAERDDDPRSGPRWRRALVVAAVAVVYFGVLAVSGADQPTVTMAARPAVFHFADPFSVEWFPLEATDGGSGPAGTRPLPMGSDRPPCVGFGRPDWPEPERQPTVAYCIDAATAGLLDGRAVAVKEHLAGFDTWYLVLLGTEVGELDVVVGDDLLAADRIYRSGSVLGLLLASDHEGASLAWTTDDGGCRRAEVVAGLVETEPCPDP